MNKCLVTTLKASTGNTNLLKMGEVILNVESYGAPTNYTNHLDLSNGNIDSLTLEVENGEANLTLDSNMSSGWSNKIVLPKQAGEQRVYFRNGDYSVKLLSKYNIFIYKANPDVSVVSIDLKNFKYSNKATVIIGKLQGDIENLSTVLSLQTLYSDIKSNLSGDIANLRNHTELTKLRLKGVNVSGDIANLSNLTKLNTLELETQSVSGNISSLSNLTNLTSLQLNSKEVYGSIINIPNLNNIEKVYLNGCSLSGNLSDFANGRELTFIGISDTSLSGNITSLATLTKLTTLYIRATPIEGEIIDLVTSQRSNGRTSGRITFETNGIITFNGKALYVGIHTISWTASTITNETTSETVNR